MGAGLTEIDSMFSVRELPWHRLPQAQVLTEYPTIEEAKKIAHPWEPVAEPLYRKVPVIHTHSPETCSFERVTNFSTGERTMRYTCETPELSEDFEEVTDYVANVRSDNGYTLGVVKSTYEPVNNSVMYEIAEALEGEAKGSVQLETGGSLLGGSKVWLMLRLRDPLVISGDPHGAVMPFYGLQNSHDGSGAFRGQATSVRIVCMNTSQMADTESQQKGTEMVFRHTRNVRERIEEAQRALAGWRQSVETYRNHMEHLITLPVDRVGAELFIEKFIPMPLAETASERTMRNVETSREAFRGILGGVTCEGIDQTAYGLVQASVEYLQHARKAHNEETRFKRAFLDRNKIVTRAVELATAIAG